MTQSVQATGQQRGTGLPQQPGQAREEGRQRQERGQGAQDGGQRAPTAGSGAGRAMSSPYRSGWVMPWRRVAELVACTVNVFGQNTAW